MYLSFDALPHHGRGYAPPKGYLAYGWGYAL